MISHSAFFGTQEHNFRLTDNMVIELERLTGTGIGGLYLRLTRSDFRMNDLIEIIRLGLIGGNMNPEEAARLVSTYAKDRPIAEILPLALDVIDARWSGPSEEASDE